MKNKIVSYKKISPCNEVYNFSNEKDEYYIEWHCKECKNWKAPKKKELLNLLGQMDTINVYEWNDYFDNFYKCGIEGKIKLNNNNYKYYLNAGGWIVLKHVDSEKEIILGCNTESCSKYFLSIRTIPKN